VRVGVFGGVFNPPHHGHLVAAQEAYAQLGLDVVLWVPVGDAPHRSVASDPGADARFEMVELAISGDERFRVSRIELEREGPSYTVDTLKQLREREPEDELFLILGGDQGLALPTWREPEDVLALRIAEIASDKVAQDIRVFDLRGIVSYTDFFVICSGGTERQTKAIHDGIYQELKDVHGRLPRRVEGLAESRWILMDYLDVVIHIFTPDARGYYRLEQLWGDAPSQTVE
jgi:ribosome-associated protein